MQIQYVCNCICIHNHHNKCKYSSSQDYKYILDIRIAGLDFRALVTYNNVMLHEIIFVQQKQDAV